MINLYAIWIDTSLNIVDLTRALALYKNLAIVESTCAGYLWRVDG